MSESVFDDREVRRRLNALAAKAPGMMARAMVMEGEIEMAEAKQRTPVDTGALRASGNVSAPSIGPDGVSVTLSFGGEAAPYAVPVHEDLSAFHTTGQAKYLESVVLESRGFMNARLAARIKSELAAGGLGA